MTDSQGTPLAVLVSSANRHDVNFMLPLVFCSFPRVGGVPGRPPQMPKVVRADAGYTSQDVLNLFAWCGIQAEIPQRGQDQPAGLGKLRWPIERTIAWLKQYRRIGIRRERQATTFKDFVTLACAIIAYKQLKRKWF